MAKHIQFFFSIEYLSAYSTSAQKAFGLNLVSVSFSPNDPSDPWTAAEIAAIARKYFVPWKAKRFDAASTWIDGEAAAGVAHTDKVRWRGRPGESVTGFSAHFEPLSAAFEAHTEYGIQTDQSATVAHE